MFAIPAFGLFFLFFAVLWLASVGGVILAIVALISVAKTPSQAFGPWWDNTKQAWLIGIAVGFVVPFGALVAGFVWFSSGRAPLRAGRGYAARPFWAGPPKPPPAIWPGYPPPPGAYPTAPYPPAPAAPYPSATGPSAPEWPGDPTPPTPVPPG
jgi:hypothetical protein